MGKLENKAALVTSATKGIGFACALKLAENGADVYMGVRRVEDTENICKPYRDQGLKMQAVYFDAKEERSYGEMVNETVSKGKGIDILINNFGVGMPPVDLDIVNGDKDAFFEIMRLNLGTVYSISKLVIPHMIERGEGSIVNISSIGGIIPDVTRIGYGVSKAAVNNITKQIAVQYARKNIRCNAVLPGLTATDAALKNMPQEFINSFLTHVLLNRMACPEDIANAVLFFACSDSSYITGHLLDVAGGYGIGTPQYSDIIRNKL